MYFVRKFIQGKSMNALGTRPHQRVGGRHVWIWLKNRPLT